MFNLYSGKKTEQILKKYDAWIGSVAEKYHMPPALIKAMLYQEMTQIDWMDILADLCVRMRLFHKTDSSTGYGQIFGYVGLRAVNFAVDEGLATYESLGIRCDHRLSEENPKDVRLVWNILHDQEKANIEISALNLLSCAKEKTGRIDFSSYSEQEVKQIFTRYNAQTDHITPYGEQAYQRYLTYL